MVGNIDVHNGLGDSADISNEDIPMKRKKSTPIMPTETLLSVLASPTLYTAMEAAMSFFADPDIQMMAKAITSPSAHDVAKWALDAVAGGKLSPQKAAQIIKLCLEDQAPTVDVLGIRLS